jgi:hypothetical protein
MSGITNIRPKPTYPTNYFQWVRRDTEAPTRVLQQWWVFRYSDAVRLVLPEKCEGGGEWRDVPTT